MPVPDRGHTGADILIRHGEIIGESSIEQEISMILVIDVGNTNIVVGCMEGEEIVFTARYSTDRAKTEDEYALMFMDMFKFYKVDIAQVEGAILSSVVPELKAVLRLAVERLTGKCPLVLSVDLDIGLNITIDNPAQLGCDLIANAVAALEKYEKPIVIFDMGTATTASVVDEAGNYIGGMIIPGLRLSVDALSARTSQLPHISLDKPEQLIGTNTINCMKSGAIYGNAAMLDGIIDRVEEQLGQSVTAVATGGLIGEIVPYCKRKVILDKDLMLHGLRILYDRNKKGL